MSFVIQVKIQITRISPVTPTGDLNKHKVAISTSLSLTENPNKHTFVISIRNCISLKMIMI